MKRSEHFVLFCVLGVALRLSYVYILKNESVWYGSVYIANQSMVTVNYSVVTAQNGWPLQNVASERIVSIVGNHSMLIPSGNATKLPPGWRCNMHNGTSTCIDSVPSEKWGQKALLQSCYTYSNCTATNICCGLHPYTAADIASCSIAVAKAKGPEASTRLSIAIVGDSRTRQIFNSLAYLLKDTNMTYYYKGKSGAISELVPRLFDIHFHTNIRLVSNEAPLNVTYYWDPYLDTWLPKLLKLWLAHPETRPQLLQIGAGAHYLVFEKEKAFKEFLKTFRELLPSISALANTTHTIVKMMDHVLVKYQSPSYAIALTDANINRMNSLLSRLLQQCGANTLVWNSSTALSDLYIENCYNNKQTTKDSLWMCTDAMHLGYVVIHQLRDMMLNSFCNRYLQMGDYYCAK